MTEFENRDKMTLFLCDESSITCATHQKLRVLIDSFDMPVVLAMPNTEYEEGLRGYVKAQILTSVANNINSVIPLDYLDALDEIGNGWGNVYINGNLVWNKNTTLEGTKHQEGQLKILETDVEFDREMMDRARGAISQSNCWLDPAGCVFTREGEVLVESTSTSLNGSQCTEIPVKFDELSLNPGERMHFCDAQHAERVGISLAAKNGVSLDGSSMYVTKFPCRPCAMSAIGVGVSTIIFEQESYGLVETVDLFKIAGTSLRRVVAK